MPEFGRVISELSQALMVHNEMTPKLCKGLISLLMGYSECDPADESLHRLRALIDETFHPEHLHYELYHAIITNS